MTWLPRAILVRSALSPTLLRESGALNSGPVDEVGNCGVRLRAAGRQKEPRTHLRQIALTVNEQDPGHLYWVLIEAAGDARL